MSVSLQSRPVQEDRKLPAQSVPNRKLCYYAVRDCDALKSPAIFTCWEDCQFYLDPDENDGNVDYKSFETIAEAVGYILQSPVLLPALRAAAARKGVSSPAATLPPEKQRAIPITDNGSLEENIETPSRPTKKLKTLTTTTVAKRKRATNPKAKAAKPKAPNKNIANNIATKDKAVSVAASVNGDDKAKNSENSTNNATKGKAGATTTNMSQQVPLSQSPHRPRQVTKRKTPTQKVQLTATNTDWNERFQELKAFHEKHGHCNVPDKPRTRLRYWVCRQRQHFDRLKKKEPSILDPDKIAKLSSIGFSFVAKPKMSFDDRAVQWLQYKSQHGCDPTKLTPGGIGPWIQKMRKYYGRFQRGEKVPVTAEQFDQLKQWGFKFETGVKKAANPAKPKPWEGRFQELLEYKEEHGHVNVPQKCEYQISDSKTVYCWMLTFFLTWS